MKFKYIIHKFHIFYSSLLFSPETSGQKAEDLRNTYIQ